jgi:hypothetical protein
VIVIHRGRMRFRTHRAGCAATMIWTICPVTGSSPQHGPQFGLPAGNWTPAWPSRPTAQAAPDDHRDPNGCATGGSGGRTSDRDDLPPEVPHIWEHIQATDFKARHTALGPASPRSPPSMRTRTWPNARPCFLRPCARTVVWTVRLGRNGRPTRKIGHHEQGGLHASASDCPARPGCRRACPYRWGRSRGSTSRLQGRRHGCRAMPRGSPVHHDLGSWNRSSSGSRSWQVKA